MKDYNLENFKISKTVKKKLRDKRWLKKELAKGKTAQEIMGLSNEAMAKFYESAYHLFEKERYVDAASAFVFLVTLNPKNHEYWMGLGMATQMCGQYEEAIDAYEMSAYYHLDSPVPYFYLAKCFFVVNERESALIALDLAVEYAADQVEFVDLKKQAIIARKLLTRK